MKNLIFSFLIVTFIIFNSQNIIAQNISKIDNYYIELCEEFDLAFKNRNKDNFIEINKKINFEHFLGENGLKFLKLKLSILTIIDNYDHAFFVFNEFKYLFNNEREVLFAQAVLSYKTGNEYRNYFHEAFKIIFLENNKTESDLVLLYILCIILDRIEKENIKQELFTIAKNNEMTLLIESIDEMEIEDLIFGIGNSTGFIITIPILFYEHQDPNSNWWE